MLGARPPGAEGQISDRDIRIAPDDPQFIRCLDLELHLRVGGRETPQSGHQPSRRESRLDGQAQAPRRNASNRVDGAMDAQKSRGELGRKLPAGRRELDRPMQTAKQLAPHILFQSSDVAADRGLRDMQLTGRVGEAKAARRGLEGPESEKRRWAARGHGGNENLAADESHESKLSQSGRQIVSWYRGRWIQFA